MCFIYSKLAEKSPLASSQLCGEALAKPVSLLLLLEVGAEKLQLREDLGFNGPRSRCWPLMGSSPGGSAGVPAHPPAPRKTQKSVREHWLRDFFQQFS